jgi:Protein of unknown function (DUF3617)
MIAFKPLSFLLACSLFAASLAFAQSTTKPGLWEVSSKMSSPTNPHMAKQMEEAQKALAAMPAAQRKQMEEMMAKQGVGMSLGSGAAAGATTIKICITPEMAARPPVEQRQGCTYKFSQSGATHNFSFQCTNPPGDGEGKITFTNADSYNGTMRVNSMQGGKKETIDMQTSGKFLGANCGRIKPLPMATK